MGCFRDGGWQFLTKSGISSWKSSEAKFLARGFEVAQEL
jgi:hypothetical protein